MSEEEEILSPLEKIMKSKIELIKRSPFYGYACTYLRVKEVSKEEMKKMGSYTPTAAIDNYGTMYYNADYIDGLSQDETTGLLMHELLHCVLEHLTRRGYRDPMKSNIAMDLAVNGVIRQDGFTLPKGTVADPDYYNKPWEMIYDELPKMNKQTLKSKQFDGHCMHDGDQKSKSSESDGDEEGKGKIPTKGDPRKVPDWKQVFKTAVDYAKQQGKLPAGLERVVEEVFPSRIDWRYIIYRYLQSVNPVDFTYTKPNKRSVAMGFFIPDIKKESINVVIGIDTSGSISDKEYAEFLGEIVGMFQEFENLKAHILTSDAAVHTAEVFDGNFDVHDFAGRGYGGTDFRPVFEWVKKEEIDVPLLIYFTDLYGSFPRKEDVPMGLDTVWVATEHSRSERVPFGKIVYMDGKQSDEW